MTPEIATILKVGGMTAHTNPPPPNFFSWFRCLRVIRAKRRRSPTHKNQYRVLGKTVIFSTESSYEFTAEVNRVLK